MKYSLLLIWFFVKGIQSPLLWIFDSYSFKIVVHTCYKAE